MPRSKTRSTARIYRLKITLRGTIPPVWRRVLVPGDVTLDRIHRVLQIVMGWTDSHLHQFHVGDVRYGDLALDEGDELGLEDERKARLSRIAPEEGDHFIYEYDFGDSWMHEVVVEQISPADRDEIYPLCIGGRGACPPEDVGGIGGYYGFLEAIGDPEHPEHDSWLTWIGGEFDHAVFDYRTVNHVLLWMQ